ncbi:hypothetical protein ABH944_003930 [Caballeronia udeis]|uniref:Uncharacterized protein n=1 Tax=Caballeronia udeis TaxID=1232866 RepID=A0ABW8MJ85_9BURK
MPAVDSGGGFVAGYQWVSNRHATAALAPHKVFEQDRWSVVFDAGAMLELPIHRHGSGYRDGCDRLLDLVVCVLRFRDSMTITESALGKKPLRVVCAQGQHGALVDVTLVGNLARLERRRAGKNHGLCGALRRAAIRLRQSAAVDH